VSSHCLQLVVFSPAGLPWEEGLLPWAAKPADEGGNEAVTDWI